MRQFIIYVALLTTFSCNSNELESDRATSKIDGEFIYKKNCASCHKLDMDYTGPALKTVFYVRSKEWVDTFLRNRSKIIEGSLHLKLKTEFKTNCMNYPDLSKEEIYATYDYCSKTGQDPPPK